MKRKLQLLQKLFLVLVIVFLAGCHKVIDFWHHNDSKKCRVKSITSYTDFQDTTIATFNYNHKGDPVSVLFNWSGTGRPHFLFWYDHKGRLTDYIGPYLNESNSYEFWYQYQYDNKGRVVGDTAYSFGYYNDGNPEPSPYFKSYSSYWYDQHQRLIKEARTYVNSPGPVVITHTYTYNNDGNLWKITESTNASSYVSERIFDSYDDKANIRRTNKIWMFIDRNYSVNNPAHAEKYNNKDLPLEYRLPGTTDFPFFLYQIYLYNSDIQYGCK